MNGCPKCKNIMGFSFGTCVRCGWNYISNEYDYIKVRVNDLPQWVRDYLVEKHDNSINNIYNKEVRS